MTYLLAIKTAVILFPLLAFLITGPFILYQYHKYTSISPLKTLIIYSFIFYLLCAYFLVILPLPSKDSVINNPDWMIQMIPFHFIVDLIKENPLILGNPKTYISAILDPSFYVVAFNILLFVPFGMFLKYYKGYSLKKIILVSLLLSAFFEFTQLTRLYGLYPKPYRLCDIDDLILNTMGGVVGYLWMLDLEKRIPSKIQLEQQAYEKGKTVSPLRRISIFILDFLIYIAITIFLGTKHPILIFIIYFTIIPNFFHNKTLGSAFLNVKIESSKETYQYLLRPYFLYFYYIYFPYKILMLGSQLGTIIGGEKIRIIFYLLLILTVFFFYIGNIFYLIIKNKIFYDKLLKVNYKNTFRD